MIWDQRGANDNPIWCIEGFNGAFFGRRRNDANSIASTASNGTTGYQYASVTFDGSVVSYRRNGVLIGTANNSGVATFDNIRIGARKNPSSPTVVQFHTGTIAEIVILPTAITYEQLLMEEYFRIKWGIKKLA